MNNWFVICLVALNLLPRVGLAETSRYAMVIGVDEYRHLDESAQLKVAVSDAKLMADTLNKADPKFHVLGKANPTRAGFKQEFDRFTTGARGADCVLFYFAGHGIEFHGKTYLLLSDSDLALDAREVRKTKNVLELKALSMDRLLSWLDELDAKMTVIILDACRNNPLQETQIYSSHSGDDSVNADIGVNPEAFLKEGVGHIQAQSGMLVSYSADVGQSANDGLFTKILTENMAKPGTDILKVFANTRVQVRDQSRKLSGEGRGVFHEPAEYCKLSSSALSFTFFPGKKEVISEAAGQFSAKVKSLTAELVRLESELTKSPPAEKSAEPQTIQTNLNGTRPGQVVDIAGNKLVWCRPAGSGKFTFGDRGTRIPLKPFWLGRTEVSEEQWEKVMKESMLEHLARIAGGERSGIPTDVIDSLEGVGADYPMGFLTAEDCITYCHRLNETSPLPDGWLWTMPTEIQWEYAACAGKRNRDQSGFAFGDTIEGIVPTTLGEAGSGPATEWGFYNIHRGVRECCIESPRELAKLRSYQGDHPGVPKYLDYNSKWKGGAWIDRESECAITVSGRKNYGATEYRASGFRVAIVRGTAMLRFQMKTVAEKRAAELDALTPVTLQADPTWRPIDNPSLAEIAKKLRCLETEASKVKDIYSAMRLTDPKIHGTVGKNVTLDCYLVNISGENLAIPDKLKGLYDRERRIGTINIFVERLDDREWIKKTPNSLGRGRLYYVDRNGLSTDEFAIPRDESFRASDYERRRFMNSLPAGIYNGVVEYHFDFLLDRKVFKFQIDEDGEIRQLPN